VISISYVASSIFERYCESRADDFGIMNSSDEELEGGVRFFKRLQEDNIKEYNNDFLSKIEYTACGEVRIAIGYPTLASRILKIEKELNRRRSIKNI
jgi:hypothetical protein